MLLNPWEGALYPPPMLGQVRQRENAPPQSGLGNPRGACDLELTLQISVKQSISVKCTMPCLAWYHLSSNGCIRFPAKGGWRWREGDAIYKSTLINMMVWFAEEGRGWASEQRAVEQRRGSES